MSYFVVSGKKNLLLAISCKTKVFAQQFYNKMKKQKIPHCRNSSKIPHCRNSSKIQQKIVEKDKHNTP